MGVYIDALIQHDAAAVPAAARLVSHRNGHRWCHMIADTEDELHALATKIGLRRAWFQGDHYDLTPGRRQAAIRIGAIALDRRAFVQKLRDSRLDAALTSLPAPARRVYVALGHRPADQDTALVTIASLSAATGLSRGAVRCALDELAAAALIRIGRREGYGGVNTYTLLGPGRHPAHRPMSKLSTMEPR
jgi:hypothetical protein